MATIKDLLSSMISKINSKVSTWEELPDKPFGSKTETVEIVPLQSVTKDEQYDMEYGDGKVVSGFSIDRLHDDALYKAGEKITVIINGKEYHTTAFDADGYEAIDIENVFYSDHGEWTWWNAEFGETITIAIYAEQEIVQQIDPKFVGGTTVLYTTVSGIYLYHDRARTKLVSKEDLVKVMPNILIHAGFADTYFDFYLYNVYRYYIAEDIEYGEVCVLEVNGNVSSFYTAEYTAGPQ